MDPTSSTISDIIWDIAFSFITKLVARKIAFEDPEVLMYARIGYVSAQLLALGIFFWTTLKIKSKNDMTMLNHGVSKNSTSADSRVVTTITVRDYDLGEVSKGIYGVSRGLAMIIFFHLYLNYTNILFSQGMMVLKDLYHAKPVKIHVFGSPAEGDLERLSKEADRSLGSVNRDQPEATIDEAEKKKLAFERFRFVLVLWIVQFYIAFIF